MNKGLELSGRGFIKTTSALNRTAFTDCISGGGATVKRELQKGKLTGAHNLPGADLHRKIFCAGR